MPNLPHYLGPYTVGFVDIESESIADQKNGVFMRIYYPTLEDQMAKSFMETWLPNSWRYANGYGGFLGVPRIASALIFYPVLGRVKMPCIQYAPILKVGVPEKLPVAIFSHGLGGARTTYSNICGNLASRGMVVVAIEHADGSACITAKGDGTELPYRRPNDADIQPNETKDEYLMKFRTSQLSLRCTEVANTIETLKNLDQGDLKHQKHADLDPKLVDAHNAFVKTFQGRLDFNEMALIGHSFGVIQA